MLKNSKANYFDCTELTMKAFGKTVLLPFWKDSGPCGGGEKVPFSLPPQKRHNRQLWWQITFPLVLPLNLVNTVLQIGNMSKVSRLSKFPSSVPSMMAACSLESSSFLHLLITLTCLLRVDPEY